jgi:hypothetical protein|tara:strand:+ start:369 stop:530 length:162 start_codon:yes stop_codon:yes gene_type:complete
MDKENLIIKVEKDIAKAEVLLKEARDKLQKQQDTLFCLKAEWIKLKECINDSL